MGKKTGPKFSVALEELAFSEWSLHDMLDKNDDGKES